MTTLLAAAKAVIDRWDTPLWKDVSATAVYIGALRQAIASMEAQPVRPDAWMIPQLQTFKGAERVCFSRAEGCNLSNDELIAMIEGTVMWTVSLFNEHNSITDRDGVVHQPKPLFTHPATPSAAPASDREALIAQLRGFADSFGSAFMNGICSKAADMLAADAKYRTHCSEYANVQAQCLISYQKRVRDLKAELEQAQQVAVPQEPPYPNCQFKICDLTGQCKGEGRCHHPSAPAYVPLTDEQTKMLNFLYGAGELDGVWFGERHPTEKSGFWWRKHLRKVFPDGRTDAINPVRSGAAPQ